jgi:primosomal protein N' (replication factor Y)
MFIIEVIPISKSVKIDTLSYFTSKEITIGSIVTVPLRSKNVSAIVIAIRNAEDIKSEIRNADFSLKKLDKVKSKEFFGKEFMEMVKDLALYNATSIGSVINSLAPEYLLENINKLKIEDREKRKSLKSNLNREKYAVQGDDEERHGEWKSLIRQEFAKKKSILFINPTIEDAEHSFELLERGIEGYAFLLHGSLDPKQIIETWNKIIAEDHPVVIITTGAFLSIYRSDIETIILDKESSRAYKIQKKPYLDIRNAVEILADKIKAKIFFADNLLRVETLYKETKSEIIAASPFKFRSLSTATDCLIDMKIKRNANEKFEILSREIQELILKSKNNSEQMIILTTRRGISPTTICKDCQTIVNCNKCSSPVVLHKNNDKSFFMCHKCGERRSAEEYCKTCNSWNLITIGIGIDTVVDEIKNKFPDLNILKMDSDSVKNPKIAKSIIQKFKSHPGSILIGTEMMLQYLHDKVDNSAIISLDSLFALPDFRISEKILYLLIRIRALTTKNYLVQTRKAEERVFEFGIKGNMSDFYRLIIEERKSFNYPPFSKLIKITLEGKKDEIIKEMELAQNILDPYEVEVFPAFTHTIKGNYVLHGLLRINNNEWPKQDLIDKIRMLSPAITIKVDPDSLL